MFQAFSLTFNSQFSTFNFLSVIFMKKIIQIPISILFLLFVFQNAYAQTTQTVRGRVIDKQTLSPLNSAAVFITQKPDLGTLTDENGFFVIENVPLGRISITCEYIGYESFVSDERIVNTVRELVFEIELKPGQVSTQAVTITANKNAYEPLNELSIVSARSFSVEETERIPAGANDPGRMVLAYPGVKSGSNDVLNDVIVRGNSAYGVQYRLEGIDISNPNHFGRSYGSGGGITVFSAQLLSRSDFSMGAFSPEYGNALSAVFDMKFRKGNMFTRASRFRLGVLGIDLATEGPIQKGRSSYLINYRYSTLSILSKMGFYLIGKNVVNNFQDLSFNLAFNSKKGSDMFTVFGMGGPSFERRTPYTQQQRIDSINSPTYIYDPENFEYRLETSQVGVIGTTWLHKINDNSYMRGVITGTGRYIDWNYDTLNIQNEKYHYHTETLKEGRISGAFLYSNRLNTRTLFKTGITIHQIFYDFYYKNEARSQTANVGTIASAKLLTVQGNGNTQTFEPYALISYDINEKLKLTGGLHLLYLSLNKTAGLDPRASLKYQLKENQTLSFGYGLQSQAIPFQAFYVQDTMYEDQKPIIYKPNFDLKLLRSHHLVASYSIYTQKRIRFQVEAYGQYLFNVPIINDTSEAYWMLNGQGAFPRFAAVSKGKGWNYGVEFTTEKQFSNKFYFIINTALYRSLYKTLKVGTFSTANDSRFNTSATIGREFTFKKGGALQIGGRVVYWGGFRLTPPDISKSTIAETYIADQYSPYSIQAPNFVRLDTRIMYRFNINKNVAGQLSLDIQNITNRKNITDIDFNPKTHSLIYQSNTSGLVPLLNFQIDF